MENKIKRFLSLAVAMVMVFGLIPMSVFAAEADTETGAWYDETATELVINSVEEYVEFAQLTLEGTTFAGQTVKLGADLDMSKIYIWYNDGTTSVNNRVTGFAGVFDGDGHTIYNMRYFDNIGVEDSHIGMAPFRNISGDIKNLTIDGVEVSVKENVRFYGLVSATSGTSASNRCEITDVTIKNMKVTMNNNTETDRICDAAGMLGNMQYTDATNCHVENAEFVILGDANYATTGFVYNLASTSTVENSSVKNLTVQIGGSCGYVGGFAGAVSNQSSITNCTVDDFTASIGSVKTDHGVGGFGGTTTGNWGGNSATFTDCHVTDMNLTVGTVNAGVGGFIGSNYGGGVNKFIHCTTSGTITANDGDGTTGVGGFIGNLGGRSGSTVTTNCENCVANVTVSADSIPAGGFIGTASASTATYKTPVGIFTNCNATGNVTSAVAAGGFAGTAKMGSYSSCTATGTVLSETGYAAGLIGLNLNESAVTITDCTSTTGYTGVVEDDVYNVPAVAAVNKTGYATLKEAVAAANDLGTATVNLLADVTLGEKLTITGDVTIQGAHTITRDDAYTGTFFTVNAGAALTLDGDLVIDGGNKWTLNTELYNQTLAREVTGTTWAQLITSEEGKPNATAAMFVVNGSVVANNVTIQNNYSTKDSNSGDGGVFKVGSNATLSMTGATVKHIVTGGANSVAYLASNAVWTINDRTEITDNFAGRNGGVCRNDSGLIVMNGGEIKDNKSLNTNGTVFMMYQSNFEMNGGTICGNSGISGSANGRSSAIYLHTYGVMTMNGGTICHNTGISYGGIDTYHNTSKLTIIDGNVYDNVSVLKNMRHDVNMNGTGNPNTAISGGWYSQDVTEYCAPGYCAVIDFNEDLDKELWHVVPAVAYNVNRDLYYGDLSYALSVAASGETVQLLRETTEELVLVPAGVTFDLNGNVVTANNVLSFGVVKDNQEDMTKIGGIKIDIDTTKAFTKLQPENGGYLPIYDTNAGQYKFFKYELVNGGARPSGNSVKFGIQIFFDNVDAYTVLANTENSGIKLTAKLVWSGMSVPFVDYELSDSSITKYAEQKAAAPTVNYAITLTLHGLDNLSSGDTVNAAPSISTITEVAAQNDAMVHIIG